MIFYLTQLAELFLIIFVISWLVSGFILMVKVKKEDTTNHNKGDKKNG